MTRPLPEKPGRILIRVNNWIGDVVMISPAVRAVRARYPRARIAILAKSWVLDTLRGSPDYDDLIEYDQAGRHGGLQGRMRLAAELRRGRFDLALLFQKAFEAALLAFLARIPVRIGYATDGRTALLTHPISLPPEGTHHAELFAGLVRALGCDLADLSPIFHLDDAARARGAELLRTAGWDRGRTLIALHPGASKGPRAWHPERFAALAGRLAQSARAQIVLLGGPADREAAHLIASGAAATTLLMPVDTPSIKEMAAILERCRLFIGNDSGPMHVAAALGVPTVGIFGPGSPRLTAPIAPAPRLSIVDKRYPCSPCRQDFFRECSAAPSGKPFCLEEITVEEVVDAATTLLAAHPDPRRGA